MVGEVDTDLVLTHLTGHHAIFAVLFLGDFASFFRASTNSPLPLCALVGVPVGGMMLQHGMLAGLHGSAIGLSSALSPSLKEIQDSERERVNAYDVCVVAPALVSVALYLTWRWKHLAVLWGLALSGLAMCIYTFLSRSAFFPAVFPTIFASVVFGSLLTIYLVTRSRAMWRLLFIGVPAVSAWLCLRAVFRDTNEKFWTHGPMDPWDPVLLIDISRLFTFHAVGHAISHCLPASLVTNPVAIQLRLPNLKSREVLAALVALAGIIFANSAGSAIHASVSTLRHLFSLCAVGVANQRNLLEALPPHFQVARFQRLESTVPLALAFVQTAQCVLGASLVLALMLHRRANVKRRRHSPGDSAPSTATRLANLLEQTRKSGGRMVRVAAGKWAAQLVKNHAIDYHRIRYWLLIVNGMATTGATGPL